MLSTVREAIMYKPNVLYYPKVGSLQSTNWENVEIMGLKKKKNRKQMGALQGTLTRWAEIKSCEWR